jgi:hypothetical protein
MGAKAGLIIGAALLILVGIGLANPAAQNTAANSHAAVTSATPDAATASSTPSDTPTPTDTPTDTPTPTPTPTPTVAPVIAAGATGTALAQADALTVKGRAPMTGYTRAQFGPAWADVDGNGCDTRNDILARDLSHKTMKTSCLVASGMLHDPYTNATMSFVRGPGTSTQVQIDHVVALGDAWATGAQTWTVAKREALANDPLNLLAVDAHTNQQKSDSDAASWLPPAKSYRCAYVARQTAVKTKYHLWATPAEKQAIIRVLAACPTLRALAPGRLVLPASRSTSGGATGSTTRTPSPTPTRSSSSGGTRIVHAGAFCSPAGATGVTSAGTPMVCKSTATDPRNRWRRA